MLKRVSFFILLLSLLVLSACSTINDTLSRNCPDAEIDWVDALMINDIKYYGDENGLSDGEPLEKGRKIGEVKYKLSDNACSDHILRNGDAAYLSVGTEIYEMVGYDSDFRVIAGGRVYQVSENKSAKTIADLLDIEGKVEKISLRSNYDGSYIADFTEEETEAFMNEFLSLEYLGFDKIYEDTKGEPIFLRIHLKDGSSFSFSYWLESNVINKGAYGTEKMNDIVKTIVEKEL